MMRSEDRQISLTDPDVELDGNERQGYRDCRLQRADRGRYAATSHPRAREVINVGSDRHQLLNMSEQARDALGSKALEVVADRGYYEGEEIRSCEEADITVTLPKPQTSSAKAKGRFGKQDFVYVAAEDVYHCPAGERLSYRFAGVEDGKTIRRYWTRRLQELLAESAMYNGI